MKEKVKKEIGDRRIVLNKSIEERKETRKGNLMNTSVQMESRSNLNITKVNSFFDDALSFRVKLSKQSQNP